MKRVLKMPADEPLVEDAQNARAAITRGNAIRHKREALGWSQTFLGSLVGTTQQTVDRIERGQTTHSRALGPILAHLGMNLESGLNSSGAPVDDIEAAIAPTIWRDMDPKTQNRLLKVFGMQSGAEPLASAKPVNFIERPYPLLNVDGAYGIVVEGIDMMPVFRPGDVILVNPHVPAWVNNDVYLPQSESDAAKIRTIVRVDENEVAVCSWNPKRESRLDPPQFGKAQVIVGKFSRL
jgi:transcriptional regulator with XRE-family HTH domain